ncbi:radical SAM protein [Streptomyces clavuligerus]|uniref:Radical SAM domain protein n=1 Tax=Streptomyces clavuligerus TaxID=1901 RepID=D5SM91_STRCL|nr:radical SAM protein [Streptomyces clavuligerus]EFG05034.1 Radical SAM domain protein [Streptomyces clavuligerus]MBY6306554.1 radical SAM protein [Streptomyces clavuligerus]QCS10839.1 radical SAM protein [Streptomyces clavuligerus]QPJ97122.1 radical SAM protein [Streptomyces clavuligerus]WDN57541.1 radical SAM protein [Streptomyces clavuligerus]
MTIAPEGPAAAPLRCVAIELTARCQLTCSHCYAESGPTCGHGSMSTGDWRRVITEAAALGAVTVQLIGGEPSLSPGFTGLVGHALDAGLRVRVYTNLYRVRGAHWSLYEHPRVDLACSYYSDEAAEHDRVTGRAGSHTATRANIVEAVRRGIRVEVGIVDLGGGQRVAQARAELEALGVAGVRVDRVRRVGNAAGSVLPSTSALCGRCGDGKAAILPDGTVAPCEIGRFLPGGSVADGTSLASVLASDRWARLRARIPHRAAAPCDPECAPLDDSQCGPVNSGPCGPGADDDGDL